MKRLFIILLILCPYISYGYVQAQIFSTSSATHHSYSTSGGAVALKSIEFRSTSVYNSNINSNTQPKYSSTAPMNIANGAIKTAASSIKGGVLAEDGNNPSNPARIQGRRNSTMEPPTNTDAPIGEGWDVALLLALLCVGYVVRRYLTQKQVND